MSRRPPDQQPPSDHALRASRSAWHHTGARRPPFAVVPGPGQESVWDYPRPPVCVPDRRCVTVHANGRQIAASSAAIRVLETASPPTFYLPLSDVDTTALRDADGSSFCEWKGAARYYDVVTPAGTVARAAWCYPDPFPDFAAIRDHLAFYPDRVTCAVDGEAVRAQAGGFYGGWVTDEIVGPYKGEPGTGGW